MLNRILSKRCVLWPLQLSLGSTWRRPGFRVCELPENEKSPCSHSSGFECQSAQPFSKAHLLKIPQRGRGSRYLDKAFQQAQWSKDPNFQLGSRIHSKCSEALSSGVLGDFLVSPSSERMKQIPKKWAGQ